MTHNKLTDERIAEMLISERKHWPPEVIAILEELQDRRKADRQKPVAWLNKQGSAKVLFFQKPTLPGVTIPLYAAPVPG